MSLEGNKNRIHEGILDSLRRSQNRQAILDMRVARNKRAFGRAWDKTVERFGGRRGETTNPIIKGIMPDGSEAPGHRGRWKKTETSNPRDTQWLQTYRQERSARLKRSDAVRSSIERIAAGVLAGTMALTGRGLLSPSVVNKAAMDKKQELRQSIDNKQRRDEMSLENTLREMMNEAYGSMVQQAAAKIRKGGTPETRAHQEKVREHELLRGAIRRRIPSTDVARVVAKSDAQHLADLNPMPISRRERRAAERRTRTDREQGLMEHYKQRLQESIFGTR